MNRHASSFCCAAALLLSAGCIEQARVVDTDAIPGESLVGVMKEGDLERIATEMAEALRQSPQAATATRPLHIAPPTWTNATDVPLDRPAAFMDTLTARINDRCGGNIQFQARPTTQPAAPAAPADFASRLSLLPDAKDQRQNLILRLELIDGASSAFKHDETFAAVATRVEAARTADRRREARLDAARQVRRPTLVDNGEVRYGDETIADRVRFLDSQAKPAPGGRLEFNAHITTMRDDQPVVVQLFFYDAENHLVEVSRPVPRTLHAGRPVYIKTVSQLPAARCVIMVSRD